MPTLADTSAVDTALIAILAGDAPLMALCPDGVHWDVAPAGATAFVIVSQIDHDDAPAMPNKTVWERTLYLVKAVTLGAGRATVVQAAFRMYELLQDAPLAPTGYALMVCQRIKRVPAYTEIDEVTDARWSHCGGHYELMVCPQ
jgi:hypothetical protein